MRELKLIFVTRIYNYDPRRRRRSPQTNIVVRAIGTERIEELHDNRIEWGVLYFSPIRRIGLYLIEGNNVIRV